MLVSRRPGVPGHWRGACTAGRVHACARREYTLGLEIHCRLNEGAVLRASCVAAAGGAERRVSGGSARPYLA